MSSPRNSPCFVYSFSSLQIVLFQTSLSIFGYDAIRSQPDAEAPPTAGLSGNVTKRGYVISSTQSTQAPPPHGDVIASYINARRHSQRHFYLQHRRMKYMKHDPSATWTICLNWSRLIAQTAFLSTLATLENQTVTGATAKRQADQTNKGNVNCYAYNHEFINKQSRYVEN